MSEYQFIHFLAIDRPLDDKQLAFMEQQSTRAEISRWEFTNEYHFGDFRGNAKEMLRRGYDVHLHYANFGIRKLMFHLPAGLPCDRADFKAYCVEGSIQWEADKKGPGGILTIDPEGDAGQYEEDIFSPGGFLSKIATVRQQLMEGDLRALYLAWLVCAYDDGAMEPPVPVGLGKLTPGLKAMAEFYELSDDLIAAAAERSPQAPSPTDPGQRIEEWIARQSSDKLRDLVRRMLTEDVARVRAETLSQVRGKAGTTAWPLTGPSRTLAELRAAGETIRDRRVHKEEQKRETARRKRLATMAADPQKVAARVEKLVAQRSLNSYDEAAEELVDLREALGPETGPARVQEIAERLRRKYPKANQLISTLRRHNVLK